MNCTAALVCGQDPIQGQSKWDLLHVDGFSCYSVPLGVSLSVMTAPVLHTHLVTSPCSGTGITGPFEAAVPRDSEVSASAKSGVPL
jgi:hypothetical protein